MFRGVIFIVKCYYLHQEKKQTFFVEVVCKEVNVEMKFMLWSVVSLQKDRNGPVKSLFSSAVVEVNRRGRSCNPKDYTVTELRGWLVSNKIMSSTQAKLHNKTPKGDRPSLPELYMDHVKRLPEKALPPRDKSKHTRFAVVLRILSAVESKISNYKPVGMACGATRRG